MPFRIRKSFTFSASHTIGGLPDDHPCARLHGHNYTVTIELENWALDQRGMVVDYNELSPFKEFIDDKLDHRHLNDVLGHDRTTAEQLAFDLFTVAREMFGNYVTAVAVKETDKTWAEYRSA